MKILYYYPARFPVTMYGGTPRVIQWLISEMASLGQEIYLMALSGSKLDRAEIIPITEDMSSEKILSRVPEKIDLIHIFSYKTLLDFKKPLIITFDRLEPIKNFHPNTVFIGKKQAELHHSRYYVHHGLPYKEYPYSEQKEDYLMFIAPVNSFGKNLDGAIRLAKDSGMKLIIAGGYRFTATRKIQSVGVISEYKKRELLSKAKALLFPILWDEPFGLVMIEAFACGTPVIGTPYGEIPEVVKPGTGFVCRSHSEMISAVKNINSIKPADCRRRVEDHFNSRRMAQEYLALYQKVVEHGYFDPEHKPWQSPGVDLANVFHFYEGYKPPGFFWKKFGPKLNSLYTRWREFNRIYEPDELHTKDLTE